MEDSKSKDLELKILYWYGLIFGGMYILYAAVSIILSFLDRTYEDLGSNFVIFLYGVPFIIFSNGLRNRRRWGWIGYTALMALILVLSFLASLDVYRIAVLVLSAAAMVLLLLPSVRKHFFAS
jgi:hypothetical protein